MKKQAFINRLNKGIRLIGYRECQDIVKYYSEIIDDKIDEGMDEEDAVESLGSVDKIIAKTLNDNNIIYVQNNDSRERKNLLIIVIVVLTFPLWIGIIGALLGVLVAFLAVALSGIVVSLCGLGLLVKSIVMICLNNISFIELGSSFILIGVGNLLTVLFFKFGKWIVKGTKSLVKMIFSK